MTRFGMSGHSGRRPAGSITAHTQRAQHAHQAGAGWRCQHCHISARQPDSSAVPGRSINLDSGLCPSAAAHLALLLCAPQSAAGHPRLLTPCCPCRAALLPLPSAECVPLGPGVSDGCRRPGRAHLQQEPALCEWSGSALLSGGWADVAGCPDCAGSWVLAACPARLAQRSSAGAWLPWRTPPSLLPVELQYQACT